MDDSKENLNRTRRIETQAQAVIYFMQRMDIEMVDAILEDNRTYQDFEKSVFITKLGLALHEFTMDGDTFLKAYSGTCDEKDCHYKCKEISFIGNNTHNYLDLVIEIKEGIIHDMYECREFKRLTPGVDSLKRIRINKFAPDF